MKRADMNMTAVAIAMTLALSAGLVSTAAVAQDKVQDQTMDKDQLKEKDKLKTQDQLRDRDQDQIYGSQLMTQAERNAYHAKMRMLKTEQEREQYRLKHHEEMQERARAKGMTLPDAPILKRMGDGVGGSAGSAGGAGGKK
jgi:hypothetical protein